MSDDESKIIIDEDWKSQVEREKQKALEDAENAPEEPENFSEPGENFTLFDSLISGIAAQTMVALGLSGEEGQQVKVDLGYAHHLIATLLMLQEKSAGKLEEGEAANLDEALGELQRIFAIRQEQVIEMQQQQQPEGGAPESNIIDLNQ